MGGGGGGYSYLFSSSFSLLRWFGCGGGAGGGGGNAVLTDPFENVRQPALPASRSLSSKGDAQGDARTQQPEAETGASQSGAQGIS